MKKDKETEEKQGKKKRKPRGQSLGMSDPDEKLTPERVARAIFSAVKPPDPKKRVGR